MTLKEIQHYLAWYIMARNIERKSIMVTDYVNANMPKNATMDELSNYFEAAVKKFNVFTLLPLPPMEEKKDK